MRENRIEGQKKVSFNCRRPQHICSERMNYHQPSLDASFCWNICLNPAPNTCFKAQQLSTINKLGETNSRPQVIHSLQREKNQPNNNKTLITTITGEPTEAMCNRKSFVNMVFYMSTKVQKIVQ